MQKRKFIKTRSSTNLIKAQPPQNNQPQQTKSNGQILCQTFDSFKLKIPLPQKNRQTEKQNKFTDPPKFIKTKSTHRKHISQLNNSNYKYNEHQYYATPLRQLDKKLNHNYQSNEDLQNMKIEKNYSYHVRNKSLFAKKQQQNLIQSSSSYQNFQKNQKNGFSQSVSQFGKLNKYSNQQNKKWFQYTTDRSSKKYTKQADQTIKPPLDKTYFFKRFSNQLKTEETEVKFNKTCIDEKFHQKQNLTVSDGRFSFRKRFQNYGKQSSLKKQKVSINDFQLGECKGEGSFGQVFLAKDKKTGMVCAIKKVKKQSLKYLLDQFILQIKIQLYLSHPNIVKLYGFFADADHFYMILEYMEGGSLYNLIQQKKTISQNQASMKLNEVARALQNMHNKQLVHRDLKPQNVVLTHNVCKLCDFGWAAACSKRRKTYCGTLDYVSPQILQGQQYDTSVDIWCIGILAYEMIVGKAPFYDISKKQTLKKIRQCNQLNFPVNISKQAKSFIQNILKKNPKDRITLNAILNDPFLTVTQE